ncbi:hypothetical protein JRQ81_017905 [Phrynocephalus forsythii]|uniref:1-alkyl-2-acetylglycerophosphocholine esterase n=1 Tax=Phrynocephalus forsythii TaxID=171643 RepID=A0A9Q0XR86_9SAUR|nr:hypothetical protein JRQ81_017905 [Phrynocephalus forsythii]
MAPKKGQGAGKGKQPAQKRQRPANPVAELPSGEEGEESWPIWLELESRLIALEAAKGVGGAAGSRPSKARKRAQLKEVASNLSARFAVLEGMEAAQLAHAASTATPAALMGPQAAPGHGDGEAASQGDEASGRESSDAALAPEIASTTQGLSQQWPLPIEHLQRFLVHLHRKGLAPASLQGNLAALAFYAKLKGHNDTTGDFRVRGMIAGWSRERGTIADDRFPLTPQLLVRMGAHWPRVCRDASEVSLFRAASLLAFFGALRVSEMVAASWGDKSFRALTVTDVTITTTCLTVRVRRSKTDQQGRGAVLTLGPCSVEAICPVRAMSDYLACRGPVAGYLFQHTDGTPLTKFQFGTLAGKVLQQLGVGSLRFGTHSFRIGAASTAAALGYPRGDIRSCRESRARVVFLGHSYVYWAEKFARRSGWGPNLGLGNSAVVDWRGKRGMRWREFRGAAWAAAQGQPPDILLVHLGGNDLTAQTGKSLILEILRDFAAWKALFPASRIVWSTLIPRQTWQADCDPQKLNRSRRGVNQEVCRAVSREFGAVVGHPEFGVRRTELYRPNGVHLSDAGMELFLRDIQRGLAAELATLDGEPGP